MRPSNTSPMPVIYRQTSKALSRFSSFPTGWRSLVALCNGERTYADMRRLSLCARFCTHLEIALFALCDAGYLEVCR